MHVYKDKQFLIFALDDGSTVKYDFECHHCIGKKGDYVTNLQSQLRGITMDDIIASCDDRRYGNFLRFVKINGDYNGRGISNIGTILSRVRDFKDHEQFFAAGVENIAGRSFSYSINEVPKALLRICREHHITLSNKLVEHYKQAPDAYQSIFKFKYESLTKQNLESIILCDINIREPYGEYTWQYKSKAIPAIPYLMERYGYTVKALMQYIDYLFTFEALSNIYDIIKELNDYCTMMSTISPKFDKYPRHFLTTHKIASRNYNRLKQSFDEELFQSHINKEMEYTFGEYRFIYPKSTQEIKDEAVAQNNCVASYIKRVMDGECDILFLRYKDRPEQSLVTIEVRDGEIVQAKQHYNHPISYQQQDAVDHWNRWYKKKLETKNNNMEAAS